MASSHSHSGHEISQEMLAQLTGLYENGFYVQASALAATLPPVGNWRGTAARLIGGRLASNLHAPRLARWLHGQTWRRDKTSPAAAYYQASSLMGSRGPLVTWKFLRALPPFPSASAEERADLLTLQARVVAVFRDFDRATALMAEAESLGDSRPWFWVEKGSLYEQRDAYEDALAATRRALELHPWFRPAVQSAAHQLQLLGRDDEALDLLGRSLDHLESSGVAAQLALLQTELGQHAAALDSWERVRPLAPWMEPKIVEWWEARMSDARYFAGDLTGAAESAARSKNPFHEKLVDRLKTPAADARRVLLPVGFVRQHHFTCAPATLSALSQFWNKPVDHLALAAAICYDGTPDHIERHWAEENGWHAREFRVTWKVLVALLDRGVPFTLTTVETQSAHLQAVIGYDSFRGTLLIRDPYERTHGEWLAEEFLERYAASGPRGMLLIPPSEASRLDGLELPDASLYDEHYRLHRALHRYDRETAQGHFEAMERADAAHRLTLQARRSLAWYDGSLPRQLSAVEGLLALYPKNGNFLWSKLAALRELTRRAEYQEFLRQLAAEKDSEVLFWREWAGELNQDARRQDDARRLLLRALHFRPVDADNLHALANVHWDRREFAEATELYRLAASLRDKVDFYSRSYFLAARHLRQTEAALGLLVRRFEQFGAQSSQPVKLLFWALTMLDRQPEAFEKLEVALAQRPDDGELLLHAADAYARHGNPERGEALLAAADKRAPRAAWLRAAANLADYRCDPTAALGFWREILAEEPLAMDAQRAVTRLLAETAGRTTALAHLQETCERFDHHIGLHELQVEWMQGEGHAAAEPVLRRLLALHPEHAWAHRELALACSALHHPEEAAAALEVAAQLEPHSAVTAGVRARVALHAGRFADAREHARAALRLSIDYDTAIHDLLAASQSFEEKRAAIGFIREELIRQVVFGDGLLAYREAAFEIIDPPELLASLREAHAARPDLWHAWSAVVLQLVDMHKFDEALTLAQQATERFPLLPRLWLDLAQVHKARREREAEIPPLRRALQLSPAWGRAGRFLADTYQRLGNYDEAARVLEKAIAAAPLDAANHGCMADVLWHLGRRGEAVARLEHALKLDPGYGWAWDSLRAWSPETGEKNRAVILAHELTQLRAGEARSWYFLAQTLTDAPLAEKLAALDRASALSPRFTDAHDLRAQLLAEAGRFDEATAACDPVAYGGDIPTALRGRAAWIEAASGHTRAAIARMRVVVADAPDYYWGWNMLADWHCADHDFAAAEEAAKKMARLAPRSAIPLGYLADVQLKNGEEEAAYSTLQRAYEIDPTYAFAGFALFDRSLKNANLSEAGRLLQTIATHLPGPRTLAAQVRLHARRDDRTAAFAAFRELLCASEENAHALQAAVKALVEARWSRDVEDALADSLAKPGVNPEVGALWVRRFAARGAWNRRKRLYQIPPGSELGRRARVAYIEELAIQQRTWLLRRLLSRERAYLRESSITYGTVAYAYVHLRRWRDIVRWMHDWRRRNDLQPWMLVNLSSALRHLRRDADALEVNRRALQLRRDHTTVTHQLWLAWHAGVEGDIATVETQLAEIREYELDDYGQAHLALVKALHAMYRGAPEERARIFAQQRDDLARRAQKGAYTDAVLHRARRRSLVLLARLSGDRWSWLRPWLPEWGGIGAPGEKSPLRPGTIAVLFLLASALLRTCSDSSTDTTPPASAQHPTPAPAPRPTAQNSRLNEPITIVLRPSDVATPAPLLLKEIPAR